MRNISFSLTTAAFLDGSKDVTRRMGWLRLKAGDRLMACKKCMGLKKGEAIERLGEIEIVSVRREELGVMLDDLKYGGEECRREGFGNHPDLQHPLEFVNFFCESHKDCYQDSIVTRIEFKRL